MVHLYAIQAIIAIVLVLLIYRVLQRWSGGTRYRRVTLRELRKYFVAFNKTWYLSGMILTHRQTKRFVQFIRVKSQSGPDQLENLYALPEVQWSANFFPKIKEVLAANRIQYASSDPDENVCGPQNMIFVRCGSNVVKATRICELVLLEVFGLGVNDLYDIMFLDTPIPVNGREVNAELLTDRSSVTPGEIPAFATTIERISYMTSYLIGNIVGFFTRR